MSFTGSVDVFRSQIIDWQASSANAYVLRIRKKRDAAAALIRKEITEDILTSLGGEQIKFKNEFNLEKLLTSDIMFSVAKDISKKFPRNAINIRMDQGSERDEDYNVLGFGETFHSTFEVEKGPLVSIAAIADDFESFTRIAINRAKFQMLCRALGFRQCIAPILFDFLDVCFNTEKSSILTIESLCKMMDMISNRPALVTVPDFPSYLADIVILADMFSLIRNNIDSSVWKTPRPYSMIMEGISDKQLEMFLRIYTLEWPNGYIQLSGTENSIEYDIFPFLQVEKDGNTPVLLAYPPHSTRPALSMARFEYESVVSEKYKFIRPLIVNALPDGKESPNHIIFNRTIGNLGSLTDSVSQICLDLIEPTVLARERIHVAGEALERRHWPIVWMYSGSLQTMISAENFNEMFLVGLTPYSGPCYYLMRADEFTRGASTFQLNLARKTGERDDTGKPILETLVSTLNVELFKEGDVEGIGDLPVLDLAALYKLFVP